MLVSAKFTDDNDYSLISHYFLKEIRGQGTSGDLCFSFRIKKAYRLKTAKFALENNDVIKKLVTSHRFLR